MFYSQCLLSRNGPLGAIWVAAYFFKKLKRSQITQIDISSSVDKILQDEFYDVTYRVLAFLLLGVVRVFSKKVDYLFSDCNDILLKVRDFMVTNKDSTQLETLCAPYFSITLPERFELDAFDLEILEDATGGHVLPREDITLKESAMKTGTMVLYSSDEHLCEELASCGICSAPHNMNENVLSSQKSKLNARVGTSRNLSNLEERREKVQSSIHESMDRQMSSSAEEEPLNPVNSCTEEDHSKQEQTQVSEVVGLDKMLEEPSMQELWGKSVCEEALFNLQMFNEFGQKANNPDRLSSEHHRNNAEVAGEGNNQIMEEDSDNMNDQIVEEHCNLTIPEASTEKLRYNVVSRDEFRDVEMSDIADKPPEHCRSFDEENQKFTEQEKLLEVEEPVVNTILNDEKHQTDADHRSSSDMTPSGHRMYKFFTEDNPLSVALDSTPISKFPEASGIITPQLLGIPTPVAKERPRISRKRRCHLDGAIVFPNKVVKRCIEDSTDLVCRREQVPRTALAAWRNYRVSNLPHCLFEPLIPYASSELTSLFCQEKLKISSSLNAEKLGGKSVSGCPATSRSVENVESLWKLDKPKGETVKSVDGVNVPSFQAVEPPEKVVIPQSPAGRSPKRTAIAPVTPLQRTQSLRSFETPQRPEISDLDTLGYEPETVEKELSLEKEQDFDLSSVNEDINSSEGGNRDQNGLSARTRVVMRYLNRCFLNKRKQREEEVVNLMPLMEGKTKKKSAMLFYEILVLKSKGYVDVKQETAYEEILVSKTSRWEKRLTE